MHLARRLVCMGILVCSCAGSAAAQSSDQDAAAAPTISMVPAKNGALIATIRALTSNSRIHYTLDGTTPGLTSQIYQAPFLIASKLTVKAIAEAPGKISRSMATQEFDPKIPPHALVWSDEFSGVGARTQPDPAVWTYDTGNSGFGNHEQEYYCAWPAPASPCTSSLPNAYIASDGLLHIVARQPSHGVYTSARMKSQGLFSWMYGRIEARIKLPESQGMWPAFWLLGNNIVDVDWPACGELDIMEHIDGSNPPFHVGAPSPGYDWVQSSVHGTGLNGGTPYHPTGFSAADWHTYGMIWNKGTIAFYVDDPEHPYETFEKRNMAGTWPFDEGPQFLLLNLAVGGDWPGNVDSTTVLPSEMLVDYVRIYRE